jgi:hypothetical protein
VIAQHGDPLKLQRAKVVRRPRRQHRFLESADHDAVRPRLVGRSRIGASKSAASARKPRRGFGSWGRGFELLDARQEADAYRRIEVITGQSRRRRWTREEKARIIAESLEAGANISEVARRNGVAQGRNASAA